MAGKISNIQGDGDLVEMQESGFVTEDDFQSLLERYPGLLAGDQIRSDDPRRWLFVKREMGIAGEAASGDRWSVVFACKFEFSYRFDQLAAGSDYIRTRGKCSEPPHRAWQNKTDVLKKPERTFR